MYPLPKPILEYKGRNRDGAIHSGQLQLTRNSYVDYPIFRVVIFTIQEIIGFPLHFRILLYILTQLILQEHITHAEPERDSCF